MGYLNAKVFPRYLVYAVVIFTLMVFTASPVYSDWEGDIDDITQEMDQDFQFGGKEEVKRENLEQANTQVREDAQITQSKDTILSPLSGKYTIGLFTFTFEIYESGRFMGLGTSVSIPTRTFSISGTVSGNQSSYTVTMSQTSPTVCTESTNVTGVFSGSGEVGTTHTFSRASLCGLGSVINGVHTKISD